jgi:hypothetical protein
VLEEEEVATLLPLSFERRTQGCLEWWWLLLRSRKEMETKKKLKKRWELGEVD